MGHKLTCLTHSGRGQPKQSLVESMDRLSPFMIHRRREHPCHDPQIARSIPPEIIFINYVLLRNLFHADWFRNWKRTRFITPSVCRIISFLPWGYLFPDPLLSIANSPQEPGQQSLRRYDIYIPKTVPCDRKIFHRPRFPDSADIS